MLSTALIYPGTGGQVRVLGSPEAPLFVAADVCAALGIAWHRDAVARLDADEKGVGETHSPGGPQQALVVTEAGLYRLAMRSNKPAAQQFTRWVVHEVLPSIRRSGGYGTAGTSAEWREIAGAWRELAMVRCSQAARRVQAAVQLDGRELAATAAAPRPAPAPQSALERAVTLNAEVRQAAPARCRPATAPAWARVISALRLATRPLTGRELSRAIKMRRANVLAALRELEAIGVIAHAPGPRGAKLWTLRNGATS